MQNAKWGVIILILSAIWLLISISLFGVLGAVLLGLGGLLAILIKKIPFKINDEQNFPDYSLMRF